MYGCTTWTMTKQIEKKLDGNCRGTLRAIWNKSWIPHPTKQHLYGFLPSFSKTIKVRGKIYAVHYKGKKNELINDVPLWTPSHIRASVGQQLTYNSSAQIPDVVWKTCREGLMINDWDWWRATVNDLMIYIYIYIYSKAFHSQLILQCIQLTFQSISLT